MVIIALSSDKKVFFIDTLFWKKTSFCVSKISKISIFSHLTAANFFSFVPLENQWRRKISQVGYKLPRAKKFLYQNKGLSNHYLLAKTFFSSTPSLGKNRAILCVEGNRNDGFQKFSASKGKSGGKKLRFLKFSKHKNLFFFKTKCRWKKLFCQKITLW